MERVPELGVLIADAREAVKDILAGAAADKRPLSQTERASASALTAQLEGFEKELAAERERTEYNRNVAPAMRRPDGEVQPRADVFEDEPARMLPPVPRRTLAKLAAIAGGVSASVADKTEHFRAVARAALGGDPLSPMLAAGTGNTSVGSEGGFSVRPDVSADIFARAAEASIWIRIGCRVEVMASDERDVIALDDSDETSDAEAGLVASLTAETSEATAQYMKLRAVTLKARKLMVLAAVSNELGDDAGFGYLDALEGAIGRAIGKKFDHLVMVGAGAGQMLGVINGAATIEVAKTVGGDPGTANTFTWNHAVGMWSRLAPGAHENAWWLVHPSVLPALHVMRVDVRNVANTENVGGFQPLGAFTAGGPTGYQLLGRPVLVTGRVKALSTRGDVVLVDPRAVAIGIRQTITIDRSPHVFFASDRLALRGRFRGDALPIWNAPRTLQEGGTTVSPYVVLAAR